MLWSAMCSASRLPQTAVYMASRRVFGCYVSVFSIATSFGSIYLDQSFFTWPFLLSLRFSFWFVGLLPLANITGHVRFVGNKYSCSDLLSGNAFYDARIRRRSKKKEKVPSRKVRRSLLI
jgi:hypothetical protein